MILIILLVWSDLFFGVWSNIQRIVMDMLRLKLFWEEEEGRGEGGEGRGGEEGGEGGDLGINSIKLHLKTPCAICYNKVFQEKYTDSVEPVLRKTIIMMTTTTTTIVIICVYILFKFIHSVAHGFTCYKNNLVTWELFLKSI